MSAIEKLQGSMVDEPTRLPREHRSRRHRPVRARTISVKRWPKVQMELGRALYPEDEHADVERPKTRGDCANGVRPCPFVSCKHHLYLDVLQRTGAIKVNFPDVEPDELERLPETCALDVADRHGSTLEEVGAIMNLTRERIQQVELTGMAKVQATVAREARFADIAEEGAAIQERASKKRRLPVLEEDFDVETFAGDELEDE